jgi:hypothetical protein
LLEEHIEANKRTDEQDQGERSQRGSGKQEEAYENDRHCDYHKNHLACSIPSMS